MKNLKKEEWLKNKPFLAPKWMAKLIWFWILKEGKEKDPYAVGYKIILLAMGVCVVTFIPIGLLIVHFFK